MHNATSSDMRQSGRHSGCMMERLTDSRATDVSASCIVSAARQACSACQLVMALQSSTFALQLKVLEASCNTASRFLCASTGLTLRGVAYTLARKQVHRKRKEKKRKERKSAFCRVMPHAPDIQVCTFASSNTSKLMKG